MIFISRNERGILKADWIASLPIGAHYVTRRPNPREVGKEDAVCPGRGKFAVARGRCVSSMTHHDWKMYCIGSYGVDFVSWKKEANLEGFDTTSGWLDWYPTHKINIDTLHRNEYVKIC